MGKKDNTIIAIIPARFGSTRFPGKSLVPIQDKPMIQWVYERTRMSRLIDHVIVATDDERIMKAVSSFGGEAVMTSSSHATGTDRVAEVVQRIECDIVVNVQGDEPLIQAAMIDEAISPLLLDPSVPMATLCKKIERKEEAFDPNTVKVVFDKNGFALYFSRAPIPWSRDGWTGKMSFSDLSLDGPMFKHIGLYVYRRDFLLDYSKMQQTTLEAMEKLEQLRVLEHGCKIKVIATEHESFGVDIPDDLSKILQRLKEG